MMEGYVTSRNTVTLFLGAAGSGKTSSSCVLMNKQPPYIRTSTPVAAPQTRAVNTVRILATENVEWQELSQEDQKFILASIMAVNPSKASDADTKSPLKAALNALLKLRHGKSHSAWPSKVAKQVQAPKSTSSTMSMSKGGPTSRSGADKSADIEALLETSTPEIEYGRLIELSPGIEALLELNMIRIMDSGGQPEFQEVLPVFLRSTSVIVFVIKLCESLDERPLVEYYDDTGLISVPQQAAYTNIQMLQQCICTIKSRTFAGKAPKLVLIGTHRDLEMLCMESREEKNQKLRDILLPWCQDELVYYNVASQELIFPLNAKCPNHEDYSVAAEIRKVITLHSAQPPCQVPLRWYCLEIMLQETAQGLGRGVMSKAECFAIAHSLHFDAESFEAALQYLDELNSVCYYPSILPNVVFTSIQVLVDIVSELVKLSYVLRSKGAVTMYPIVGSGYQKFQDHALVTEMFLESFPKHYVPSLFTPQDLVKLFGALFVFAQFSDTEYCMPCLLQVLGPDAVVRPSDSVPLLLCFSTGVPPLGVFISLVGCLLSDSSHSPSPLKLVVDRFGTPICLYRNCVKFTFPHLPSTITLIDSFAFFEVHIACPVLIRPKLCSLVREAVHNGLKKVILTLHYDCQPELAFACHCTTGSLHPASIAAAGSFWICTHNPEIYGTIDKNQQMWLTTSGKYSVFVPGMS